MILHELHIHNIRNFSQENFLLNPRFTLIGGPNGTGKTAILEALYLLSRGQSFKFREISPLIRHGSSALTVFARSLDSQTISIQKSASVPTRFKLNGEICVNSSQLAYALPCQIFYQDIFEIMDAGPAIRRSMLDWGMFHVKHSFLSLWKSYKRVLQQRNALLRQQANIKQLEPWDRQLVNLAESLDAERKEYFLLWQTAFESLLPALCDIPCSIEYFKGWDKKDSGKNLESILRDQYKSDLQKQYTQYGPHQADIIIKTESWNAKKILSRGQQKMILIAMKLSQAALLNKHCLCLMDDFATELDDKHIQRLLAVLLTRPGQYVLTSIKLDDYTKQLGDQSDCIFLGTNN